MRSSPWPNERRKRTAPCHTPGATDEDTHLGRQTASSALSHHTAHINGFRMHYVTAGSGYPLVFLHGWPQTWYEWRKIIPAVADRFTVIAPDLRGLGDSERPMTGYDKRTLASDVYALISHLGYQHVGLTGHDWGGTVAYYLAYDHPELVERLLILESTPGLVRKDEPLDLRGIRRLWHVMFQGGSPDLAERWSVTTSLCTSTVCAGWRVITQACSAPKTWPNTCAPTPSPVRCGRAFTITGQRSKKMSITSAPAPVSSACPSAPGAVNASWAIPCRSGNGRQNSSRAAWWTAAAILVAEERPDFVIEQVQEFFTPLKK